MHPNIADIFTYEIKKEIADRYFSFRKMIEEDKMSLSEKIRQHSFILEKRICFDLIRIYILLQDEALIRLFIGLSGWEEMLYYDPFLGESPQVRQRIFKGVKLRGLTRGGRFRNLVLDAYQRLVVHVGVYREQLEELVQEHENINHSIKLFYQKNDIGNIMNFLRRLDEPVFGGSMGGGLQVKYAETIEDKMRISPSEPIEQLLPAIAPLAPLSQICRELKKLVDRAFRLHGKELIIILQRDREQETPQ